MIVVDTNVLVYLVRPGEHTDAAEALLVEDDEWAAPLLWRSEFRNTMLGFIRRGELTVTQALDCQAELEGVLAEREFSVDSGDVLHLAQQSGCSAYDCEFVSLSARLGVPLVTMDAEVLKAFPRHTRRLARASKAPRESKSNLRPR